MQIDLASIGDIQSLARREALNANRKILGVTANPPRYVNVPDDSDPQAVLEFVVDVFLLESANQVVLFFAGNSGLKRIDNVLVASAAVGDLIADLNTPVEIQKSTTGQLQVVGRAKISLPTLVLDEYNYRDLSIEHVSELLEQPDGTYRDAFGLPVQYGSTGMTSVLRPQIGVTSVTTNELADLGQLGYDDSGVIDGQFGTNALQRVITTTISDFVVTAAEAVAVTERD